MELRQLQIFCTAARLLNFTRTARELGYVQSNVTGQIRQLEEDLQVRLFERLGRGIQLTHEGRLFLDQAEHILNLCQRARNEFIPGEFRGRLTIGAAETVCVCRLPQVLREYRRRYPRVEIRVQTASCQELQELLRHNSVDMALMLTDRIEATDLAAHILYQEEMVLVAIPGHILAGAVELTAEALAAECLLIAPPGCGYRPLVLAAFRQQAERPGGLMELSSMGAIKECAMCGLGIAVLPRIAVQRELQRGQLIELNWGGPDFDVKTQLAHHREKWLAPALQAFIDLCRDKTVSLKGHADAEID